MKLRGARGNSLYKLAREMEQKKPATKHFVQDEGRAGAKKDSRTTVTVDTALCCLILNLCKVGEADCGVSALFATRVIAETRRAIPHASSL